MTYLDFVMKHGRLICVAIMWVLFFIIVLSSQMSLVQCFADARCIVVTGIVVIRPDCYKYRCYKIRLLQVSLL
jgi:hypothetical protein